MARPEVGKTKIELHNGSYCVTSMGRLPGYAYMFFYNHKSLMDALKIERENKRKKELKEEGEKRVEQLYKMYSEINKHLESDEGKKLSEKRRRHYQAKQSKISALLDTLRNDLYVATERPIIGEEKQEPMRKLEFDGVDEFIKEENRRKQARKRQA